MKSKKCVMWVAVATVAFSTSLVRADSADKFRDRAMTAGSTLDSLMAAPDRAAPQKLIDQSECIAVVPHVVKVAFILGGRVGYGLASCRTQAGWSMPTYVRLKGGSAGFQIGVQAADIALFFTNDRARDQLAATDFQLGGDASIAAGPVGRDVSAGTNYKLEAEIYSYSRTNGLFAGVSIDGSVVQPDDVANAAVYAGMPLEPGQLLRSPADRSTPDAVSGFLGVLNRLAPTAR